MRAWHRIPTETTTAKEAAELAHAALKMARIIRNENPTPVTKEEAFAALEEEVTDVDICQQELALKPVGYIRAEKIYRFWERWGEYDRQADERKAM